MQQEAPETPRKRPRQERSRATVDAILMAAAHILKTEGPERTTTNRIADLAGVSIGSLYQYFPNKESVVAALRERHGDWLEGGIRSDMEELGGLPLREAVRRAVAISVAMHAADVELHNALANGCRPMKPEVEAEFRQHLTAYLDEHAGELRLPDPELASFIAIRAMEAVIHGTALDEPERLRQPHFVEEVTELFVRYLER